MVTWQNVWQVMEGKHGGLAVWGRGGLEFGWNKPRVNNQFEKKGGPYNFKHQPKLKINCKQQ